MNGILVLRASRIQGAGIFLNVGAGTDILPSPWVNSDIRPLPGIDSVADARHLPFADETFDGVLAKDIIEHIPGNEVEQTIVEWHRVLKPQGILEMRTPDFFKIFRAAITRRLDARTVFFLVFGDQSEDAGGYEWGGHKSGLDKSEWQSLLTKLGFTDVRIDDDEHEYNIIISAVK